MALETKGSIWVLCETGLGYQPYRWFNSSSWKDSKNIDIPDIKGRKHWLSIFNDVFGFYVDIFYPENPQSGKWVEILVFHPKGIYSLLNRKFDSFLWVHGDDGLFCNEILPILELY